MDDMEYLPKVIDEKITTCGRNSGSSLFPPRDWTVMNKISEHPVPVDIEDFEDGRGPAFTSGRYLCRFAGAGGKFMHAFMRIEKQIPLAGTTFERPSVRQQQASQPPDNVELQALKHFTEEKGTAAPKLLGYLIDKQDANDLVPGGYIIYLVWEKVRGVPLDPEKFWSCRRDQRNLIRENFRKAYKEIMSAGYDLVLPTSKNIIINWATNDVTISGFRGAVRTDPDEEWDDRDFGSFCLVQTSSWCKKYVPIKAEDVQDDENGWRW
ncbi:uncharacterized protein N7482_009558 [Penicillium canariense]|uniref:Uncharacterized protein n=1 Tax=Penicillium canariense TaxID=189055 RepID=A0A9W9LGE8_9EURO|nr:uncharacterized protein N7482_009558 [Penicillium canariense]KAJ5153080.1 hypothetical protein N7482_009558 [Penicillium canariense]